MREFSFIKGKGEALGGVSIHEFKRGLLSVSVLSIIMRIFKDWKIFDPFDWVINTIDREINFDFLIITFSGPVCLGMKGGRQFRIDS